ncbi:arylamine N-acetyltransferase [Amycolatopsis rhizosphaerae]|uniref:Arylamine N-acetyltransferase n=1 Tax=Amycolatopsis rhizosphaerae TaxID=2053003 RepID=A0A558DPC8_9PSEU|nr:arylamine N-acetyltransferase [Amycolatopsis rhizosphaerae]TVT62870.1 arylamine N-acetyltransferase [Amycolatopsis rhizosphaerae]
MIELDMKGYLARLGITDPEPPSAGALHRLHTAHIARVPYDSLDIQLGQPGGLDPAESAARIVRDGRTGYCFHLNGAFAALLAALGYQVTRHRGGAHNPGDEPGVHGNHLALTVTGLGDEGWFVDVGLGDGLYAPLPLVEGSYQQGPYRFGLRHSPVAPGGWRFEHDENGSFTAMDFAPEPVGMSVFAEKHEHLSRSPESPFLRTLTVQRRDADSINLVRALTLTRIEASGTSRTVLESPEQWWSALTDVFGLSSASYRPEQRDELWRKAVDQHEAHLARQSK